MQAVVFVAGGSKKGTARAGQEYESPLLLLTGAEYAAMPFQDLHERLCDALRGSEPRLACEVIASDGSTTQVFEDGSSRRVQFDGDELRRELDAGKKL